MWRKYRLDEDAVAYQLTLKTRDWGWVAWALTVDASTVKRWRNGTPVRVKNLALLAEKLGVGMQSISKDPIPEHVLAQHEKPPPGAERVIVTLDIPDQATMDWPPERVEEFQREVERFVGGGVVVKVYSGTAGIIQPSGLARMYSSTGVRVEIEMTADQAARLKEAHRSGMLWKWGVRGITVEQAPRRWWHVTRWRMALLIAGVILLFTSVVLASIYAK